jgi:tripartite-type tricarboxylate transporter receptor subunit TctC
MRTASTTLRLWATAGCTVCVTLFSLGTADGQTAAANPGQAYPIKPVRIIGVEPGGSSDFSARLVAQGLTGSLGHTVIVENRGGAGGIIAVQTVAKAPPDGYTLLYYGNPFWILPLLQENVRYDPVNDFLPIVLVTRSPNFLVVHPSLPVTSVRGLITLAKARPAQLNYASGATGSSNHLAAELFKHIAGIDIVRIPYKGSAQALKDVIGGQVQVMFATAGSMAPHVKSGRLKALAVTSAQPSVFVPDLPTMAAAGVPGYQSVTITGMFAPVGTPAAVVHLLNQECVRFLRTAEAREKFLNAGLEPVGSSPEQFAAEIKSEIAQMGKVIKAAGIKGD